MKVYYAHSKRIYNTSEEATMRELLEKLFDEVICPNRDIGEKGAIGPYLEAIDRCDGLILTEFKGFIGKGVHDETTHAIETDLEVYVYRDGEFIAPLRLVIEDVNDWAVKYARVITNVKELEGL